MPEEKDLTAFENLDRVDRHRWATACAAAFYKSQPAEAVHAVVAGGKQEWLRNARSIYANHEFHEEDLIHMWDLICRYSSKLAARGILVGGGETITLGGPNVVIN